MYLSKPFCDAVKLAKAANIENPHLEALIILSYLLDKDKSYIYSHPSVEVPPQVLEEFSSLIKKRVQRIPLAYLVGSKEFMSLKFLVNENVLIPRPETEILVEKTLELLSVRSNKHPIVLDVGTGCGNIALSLAHYNKKISVYATDISIKALKVALENRKNLKLERKVSFINCNLWDCFNNENCAGKIDILVSNPPYVRSEELGSLATELSYEPREALDGGRDGFYFYPLLIEGGDFLLKKGGYLVMEIGQGQSGEIKNLLQHQKNFGDIFVKKDYNGIDRVIIARRK